MAENDGELSFEPNQIITNGNFLKKNPEKFDNILRLLFLLYYSSSTIKRTRLAGWYIKWQIWSNSRKLCRSSQVITKNVKHDLKRFD